MRSFLKFQGDEKTYTLYRDAAGMMILKGGGGLAFLGKVKVKNHTSLLSNSGALRRGTHHSHDIINECSIDIINACSNEGRRAHECAACACCDVYAMQGLILL